MKKLFCVFLIFFSMTFLLPEYLFQAAAYHSKAKAASNSREELVLKVSGNPIKPSQSRVTHTLKSMNGTLYKVYFSGVGETKEYTSNGNVIYKGDYTLYTQKTGKKKIVASKFHYENYSLNATKKMVHIYPSNKKGQPDILAVATAKSANIETADWYYIKNGVLTKITSNLSYTLRAERIGQNQLRTAVYTKKDRKWHIDQLNFDPVNNTIKSRRAEPVNIEAIIRGWWPDWK